MFRYAAKVYVWCWLTPFILVAIAFGGWLFFVAVAPSSTPKRSFQPFLQSGSNQINNLALQF